MRDRLYDAKAIAEFLKAKGIAVGKVSNGGEEVDGEIELIARDRETKDKLHVQVCDTGGFALVSEQYDGNGELESVTHLAFHEIFADLATSIFKRIGIDVQLKCALFPRHKGYTTEEEAMKARERKYGTCGPSGPGTCAVFLCECGRFHVDLGETLRRAGRG
jgi:hypothetical protein